MHDLISASFDLKFYTLNVESVTELDYNFFCKFKLCLKYSLRTSGKNGFVRELTLLILL